MTTKSSAAGSSTCPALRHVLDHAKTAAVTDPPRKFPLAGQRVSRQRDGADRYVGLVLRPLDRCAVSTENACGSETCPLRRGVRHRRAERQLLPVAPRRHVRRWHDRLPDGFRMTVKAPRGLTHVRRLYCARALDRADRSGLGGAGRPRRSAAGAAATRPGARRRSPRLVPGSCAAGAAGAGGDGAAPPDVARRRGVRASGAARCRVCGDERRGSAVHPARHHRFRLRAAARPRPPPSTPARTPTPPAAGGPTGSANGSGRAATCGSTSTTTAAATPCTTPER